jgi:predicted Zn-dependent protease with MMP-like domain
LERLGDDPVLRFLAGVAQLDDDSPAGAVEDLRQAVAMDPEDAEVRATLATALFRTCRFEEARKEADAALAADPSLPDAHVALALLLERQGLLEASDEHFRRAAKIDPERFPAPVRMSRGEFEAEVAAAGELLPEEFQRHLAAIAVTVEDVPSDEILDDGDVTLDPELLGLFVGTALDERVHQGVLAAEPPRILLFKRNLERYGVDSASLKDEIARTLHHELAHYLGFEEEDMPGLDLH